MAAVFRVCTTLTPSSGGDGECVLFCFKAPILTVCENSPSRFKLSANAASITHWHPILWALGTAMPQWNLLWKALNPAQISPLSLLHAHTYTVFKFMSLYSFSPVKKEWSHPLFPLPCTFEFHTLRSEFVPSLEAFIKTCNNTDCGFSVHSCQSDKKAEVRIFSQQLQPHIYERKTWVKKGDPLLHFLCCTAMQAHLYHSAIYAPPPPQLPALQPPREANR